MTDYLVDMILYKSDSRIIAEADQEGEITERIRTRRRTRVVKGRCFKGLRQLTLGQYSVSLNILLGFNVEEFFSKWYNQLLSNDKRAMEQAGYNVTDEEVWEEIKTDFDRMKDIMKTNEDFKKLCESHGDSYITGFYLRKYELLVTDDIEPTDPVTSRKRNTQKLDMCYYYISTELDLSKIHSKVQ